STIVVPVISGGVIATVASPAVTWLKRHHVPRALGALIVLLVLLALGVVIFLLVLGGIVAEGDKISAALSQAIDKLQGWIEGVGRASPAAWRRGANASPAAPHRVPPFVNGVATAIRGIASLAFGSSFTVFSIFFLLKDGPALRAWVNRHLGVPQPAAET